MLVVTRKMGESVTVAEGLVTVVVCEIKGNRVKLGFQAPKEMKILRTEIMEKPDHHDQYPIVE